MTDSRDIGRRSRLRQLTHNNGPGNGKLLLLPIDQGLEHGPRDFFGNLESANPEFQLRLALEGGFSGIVLNIGLAERYMLDYAGKVSLVLKLNGKTDVPPDDEAFSPLISTVEDAVRLGAVAVGYMVYAGSPAQARDFAQFMTVRRDAVIFGGIPEGVSSRKRQAETACTRLITRPGSPWSSAQT